jgi:tRNA threonylcarbamoyladenosine biosynthesis protein TsaB
MSLVLALEWSSRRVSAALAAADSSVRERHVFLERFHAPEALALVEALLAEHGHALADVRELRIGRGPGNYSGVRLAFAWAFGAAAPGGLRLRACPSGRALARRLLADDPEPVFVLGDARRGMGWGAEFHRDAADPLWEMHTPEVWSARCAGRRAVSAEPERLPHIAGLQTAIPAAADLLRFPFADEDLAPLYLHPPVG